MHSTPIIPCSYNGMFLCWVEGGQCWFYRGPGTALAKWGCSPTQNMNVACVRDSESGEFSVPGQIRDKN